MDVLAACRPGRMRGASTRDSTEGDALLGRKAKGRRSRVKALLQASDQAAGVLEAIMRSMAPRPP